MAAALGMAGFLFWRRHMRLGMIVDGGSSPKGSPISGANGQSPHSPGGAVYKQSSGDSSQPFFPRGSRQGKLAPRLLPWRSGPGAEDAAAQVAFFLYPDAEALLQHSIASVV